ncbi:MAG TPA: hypothetical protein DCQ30_08245 [Acidimicrobiaceae bacterium]|nr:hypothetical protein [Acidimicrobiaceae bacterium]
MDEHAELRLDEIDENGALPDFRSSRMGTAEGAGRARGRLHHFHEFGGGDELAQELYEAQGGSGSSWIFNADHEDLTPEERYVVTEVREEMGQRAKEEADLIGFYVAWHRAGGFAGLERAGWHRSTIHRRVRRFRACFGTHPDTMDFSWITLDLDQLWREQYEKRIRWANDPPEYREPEPPDEDY